MQRAGVRHKIISHSPSAWRQGLTVGTVLWLLSAVSLPALSQSPGSEVSSGALELFRLSVSAPTDAITNIDNRTLSSRELTTKQFVGNAEMLKINGKRTISTQRRDGFEKTTEERAFTYEARFSALVSTSGSGNNLIINCASGSGCIDHRINSHFCFEGEFDGECYNKPEVSRKLSSMTLVLRDQGAVSDAKAAIDVLISLNTSEQ